MKNNFGALSVEEHNGKIFVVSNYKDVTLCEMSDDQDDMIEAAFLFSAAPEMLDALEHALVDLEKLGGRVLKVKSAIAKARGQE